MLNTNQSINPSVKWFIVCNLVLVMDIVEILHSWCYNTINHIINQ